MAEPIDMFALARKLVPDIEEGMPAAVREAFEAGKIKTIFRTADNVGITAMQTGIPSKVRRCP